MKTLEHQLADYCEFQEELHPRITADEVAGSPVRVSTPVRVSSGVWWATAVAAMIVLVIGGVGLLSGQRLSGERTAEPTTATVAAEVLDASTIAESFAQARSAGNTDAVVALVAEDAIVDIGPAASRSDLEAEMRWQEATGLAFTFDRCESAAGAPVHGDVGFSCFVSWTGSVATSLGYGADTFEYTIEIANDMIVSAVLINLGNYGDTTWKPFRYWMQQSHDSEIDLMYTPEWHAVLTDESLQLWSLRTAEFVTEQGAQDAAPGKEAAQIGSFVEQGSLDVTWVKHTGRDGTQPYGIDSYDAGVYTTVTEDGVYRSTDAVTWTFEAAGQDKLFPDDVSEDGRWGMAKDFFTGTLLHDEDGVWQVVPRPPETDPTGDWVWMRHLASSDDVVLVLGGPPDGSSDPDYPSVEEASYWRIDSAGTWQKVGLAWDDSYFVRAVPSGGFAYIQDGTLHTSSDGLTWIDRGASSFEWWEEGVFPGLLHVSVDDATGSQVWTSPDAVTWNYQFTAPQNATLRLTNRGIVATRWGEDNPENPTARYVESWLLNDDRLTWTTMASFAVPDCTDCAIWEGAIGDVMFLSRSTSDSSAVMYIAELPSE